MSKSKTDVWMPVYIGDYLADTMRLSTVQHGAYFLLMMEYWKQGPLPNDHDELSAIVRADRKVWDKSIWPTLKRFFSLEDDGLFHQKRADRERAFAAEKSEKRSAAARAKWDANAKQKPCKKDANASANASDVDMQSGLQNACKQGDTCASRAGASPSPSQYNTPSLRSGDTASPVAEEQAVAVIPPDPPLDARTALFRTGVTTVQAMTGMPGPKVRTLIGKWLKDCGDDCAMLNDIIAHAADTRPAEPQAFIAGAIRHRTASDFRQLETNWGLDDVDLDAALRDHERALGL